MYNASCAFFEVAGKYFGPIYESKELQPSFDAGQRARLEVAVTNLALALELILKALLLYTDRVVKPPTHDLLKLFNALPSEIQQSIEREYRERGAESGHEVRCIELDFYPSGSPPSAKVVAELHKKLLPKTDIRSILANERNAFVVWRYLSEQAKPGEATLVRVEYERLMVIMNSIQRHVRVNNPKPRPNEPSLPNTK